MKKLIFLSVFAAIALLFACEKDDPVEPGNGAEGLDISYQDLGNNRYFFENATEGLAVKWNFGNGQTAEGDTASVTYVFEGTYIVKASALLNGMPLEDSLTVVVENSRTDLLSEYLNDTIYQRLTGGLSLTEGKTWVWDSTRAGHFGVGDPNLFDANWWAAPALDKQGKSMYDDKLIFNIYNFEYSYLNNGHTYVKDYAATELGDTVGNMEDNGADYIVAYDPPEAVPFTVTRDAQGNVFIEFTELAFPSMYTGAPHKYQVLSITDDEMMLRHHYQDAERDLAWYFRFVREGYVPEVPEEKPYKIEDIQDGFEGNGNINWHTNEITGFTTVSNPDPDEVNSSANVAKYTRGTSNQWENVQMRFDYEMDLRSRNVFTLKVYFPSSNDYVTENAPEGAPHKSLQKTVSLKLQNGDAGEPWVDQAEIIQTVTETDQWVELTYDFSQHNEGATILREDLDRIILQIGGEGHFIGGEFYIDDVQLQ